MAAIAAQNATVNGVALTGTTPTATTGDTVPQGSKVIVFNGSGSGITVTVVVPGNDAYGTARPDYTVAVAAGAYTAIGPLPADLVDPAIPGVVTLICSSVGSVKLFVVQN